MADRVRRTKREDAVLNQPIRHRRHAYETELTYDELQDELDRWNDRFELHGEDWEAVTYWQEGSELFGKLAKSAPEEEQQGTIEYYRHMLVHCLLQLGRYHKARGGGAWERAVQYFRDIRRDQPDHSLANYRLGIILMTNRRYLEAADAFGRALRREAVNPEHRVNEEQAFKARMWQASCYRELAMQAAEGLTDQLKKLPAGEWKHSIAAQAEELELQLLQDARKPYVVYRDGVRRTIAEAELDRVMFARESGVAVLDYTSLDKCYLHLDAGTVELTSGLADLLRCLMESEVPISPEAIYQRLKNEPMPSQSTAIRKGMSSLRERFRRVLMGKLPHEELEGLIVQERGLGYAWNRKLYGDCRVVVREAAERVDVG